MKFRIYSFVYGGIQCVGGCVCIYVQVHLEVRGQSLKLGALHPFFFFFFETTPLTDLGLTN